MTTVVRNPPANADSGDMGLIPGSGRFPGGGHGNPLQYSSLENPMDREAWWAKSGTRLNIHTHLHLSLKRKALRWLTVKILLYE